MLQFLWLSYNVYKLNLQGRLNSRRSSIISYRKLVINGFVSAVIDYMCKSSSDLTFRMNHLFLSILHEISKGLPKMLFSISIMHDSFTGNMGSKIISAVDIVTFGDAPDWLIGAMTRSSFGR